MGKTRNIMNELGFLCVIFCVTVVFGIAFALTAHNATGVVNREYRRGRNHLDSSTTLYNILVFVNLVMLYTVLNSSCVKVI